jgi:hypothetical protein
MQDLPHSPKRSNPDNLGPDGPEHKWTQTETAPELYTPIWDQTPPPIEAERLTVTVRYWYHGRDWALADLEKAAPYVIRSLMDNLNAGFRGLAEAIEQRAWARESRARKGREDGD